MKFPPPPGFGSSRSLEQFRAKSRRQPLHRSENLLLWLVSVHLIFLPWALGSMRWWAQAISLGLAVAGIVAALWPRDYTEQLTGGAAFRLHTWPKLLRFPIFWAGFALLAYIAVQALNPAWHYTSDGRGWWMEPRPHVAWLPSGTKNPFVIGGPWRALIIYASGWLTVCAIWIGFTRRRTVQYFFVVLALNGFAIAAFAIVQRLAGNGKIFWFWKSANSAFFGPFVYKNHAGAYLLLILAICIGLATWFYLRGLRRMEKSSPAGIFAFFGAVLAIGILVSYARGATVFMLAFIALAGVVFLVFHWRQPRELRKPLVSIAMMAGFAVFAFIGLKALSADQAWSRFQGLLSREETSIVTRQIATTATWEMFQANWTKGAGAGSFRFLFPIYQQHHPEIYTADGRRQMWEHAHNDFVQIPAELGAFGIAVILFGGGYWLWQLARFFFWENPFSLIVCLGSLIVMAHAWTDFLFQNPAILITWCALWPALALWTESEEKKLRS